MLGRQIQAHYQSLLIQAYHIKQLTNPEYA